MIDARTGNLLNQLLQEAKMNPLQKAAFELDEEALGVLLKSETDLAGSLLATCSSHDPDRRIQRKIISLLVRKGVDVNEIDKNGVTPLHRPVRFRAPAAVKRLLELGALVNAQDKKSHSTPLHRAVVNTGAPATANKQDSVIETIRLLLDAGADASILNRKGRTCLSYVSNEDVAQLFD